MDRHVFAPRICAKHTADMEDTIIIIIAGRVKPAPPPPQRWNEKQRETEKKHNNITTIQFQHNGAWYRFCVYKSFCVLIYSILFNQQVFTATTLCFAGIAERKRKNKANRIHLKIQTEHYWNRVAKLINWLPVAAVIAFFHFSSTSIWSWINKCTALFLLISSLTQIEKELKQISQLI